MLNAIYETDFAGFSYGFRPERSQYDALDALAVGLHRRKVGWVLDAEFAGFFDTIPHHELMLSIARRIVDRDMLALIKQWLTAPVETIDGDGVKRMEGAGPISWACRKVASLVRWSRTST